MSSSGKGFEIKYPAITLHAISRAESGPSIYCQLDDSAPAAANGTSHADDGEETIEMRELTIVPQRASSRAYKLLIAVSCAKLAFHAVETIFEALSLCASLHPDPTDDLDDDEEDAFIDADPASFEVFTGDEGQELSEVGRVRSDFQTDNRYQPY